MRRIVVVGSLNMDFVVSVESLPAPGQTVLGRGFRTIPGGKGANQACAAGRLGRGSVETHMLGRVGDDVFGESLRSSLSEAGVDVSEVRPTPAQPTGVALIWVDRAGQNSIVVAAGANAALTPADIESMRPVFRGARFVLFQLESPPETVSAALRAAREEGARTILDPAPARPLSPEILSQVDILTPNETEAAVLGFPKALREGGPGAVILKLGERGCSYFDKQEEFASPGFPVVALDTTAAGDTFNGALAVALAEDASLPDALRFANAAAALSVTRKGAQASIPTRAEVDSFLAGRTTRWQY